MRITRVIPRRVPRQQGRLFEARLARSPFCLYQTCCGAQVELGEPKDCGGCINTPLRCTRCGKTGISSERKP
jgi:hypothetical protein